MPRSPRVSLEGGIYHVYNRVTCGERVLLEGHEALFLLDTMRVDAAVASTPPSRPEYPKV